MRSTATVSALCAVLLTTGLAQAEPAAVAQPTAFETFAVQPAAHVSWSKYIGRLEKGDVRVAVTALVVQDASQPARRMRGVRIDLANAGSTDQVFLDASKLVTVMRALDEIESSIPWAENRRWDSPKYELGAAEFWHPDQTIHTLSAVYYVAPDSKGLGVSAGTAQS